MSLVRLARLVGATLLVLLLAACGSQLDPDTVARASGDTNGSGNGGSGVGDGGTGDTGTGGDTGAVDGAGTGGDTGSGAGSSGSGSGSGGTGSSGSSGSTGGGGGKGSATGGVKAGSCAGFKNQKGITDKTITIANVADISGPVPGIFETPYRKSAMPGESSASPRRSRR